MSSYKNLEALVEKYVHKYEALSLVLESVQQERDEYRDLYSSSQEKLEAAERERDELRAEQAEHDEQIARMESKFSLAKRALDSKTARCEKAEADLRRRYAAANEPEFYVRYRSDGGYEGPLTTDATEEYCKQSRPPLYTGAPPAVLSPEKITEIMQDAWNEFCDDTGCYPDDFEYQNEKLFFDAGRWAMLVAERISSLGAQQQKVVELPESFKQSNSDNRHVMFREDVIYALDAAGVKWEVKK